MKVNGHSKNAINLWNIYIDNYDYLQQKQFYLPCYSDLHAKKEKVKRLWNWEISFEMPFERSFDAVSETNCQWNIIINLAPDHIMYEKEENLVQTPLHEKVSKWITFLHPDRTNDL